MLPGYDTTAQQIHCKGSLLLVEDLTTNTIYCGCPSGAYIQYWTDYSAPSCVSSSGCDVANLSAWPAETVFHLVDANEKFCAVVPV